MADSACAVFDARKTCMKLKNISSGWSRGRRGRGGKIHGRSGSRGGEVAEVWKWQ